MTSTTSTIVAEYLALAFAASQAATHAPFLELEGVPAAPAYVVLRLDDDTSSYHMIIGMPSHQDAVDRALTGGGVPGFDAEYLIDATQPIDACCYPVEYDARGYAYVSSTAVPFDEEHLIWCSRPETASAV